MSFAALPVKPRLRGTSHAVAAVAAVPVGIWLIARAPSTPARVAAVVYAGTMIAMFGMSAGYHLGRWYGQSRRIAKAADHVTIFCFIAGSYGPLAALRLSGPVAAGWLGALWAGVLAGSLVKIRTLDRLGGPADLLYGVLGVSVLPMLPALAPKLTAVHVSLLLGGLAWYGLSSLALMTRRPDPWPATFGYHEVAHLCVVGGVASHVTLYAMLFR